MGRIDSCGKFSYPAWAASGVWGEVKFGAQPPIKLILDMLNSKNKYTTSVLKSLILESKDGEWGKDEWFDDSVLMRLIRGTDFESVRRGDISSLPRRYVKNSAANRKILQPNDIVFESAGGTKMQPTGRSVFIKKRTVEESVEPITCASFSRFIRIDPAKSVPRYIFWLLQYLYNERVIFKYNTQHTGVSRFQYTLFSEREPLSLPPLPVQRKIAAILSAYDDLIENNERRIKILEEMAQNLYREWFVDYRFPGHEKARYVESPLGKIPKGWEVKEIGDVIDIVGGGTPSTKNPEYWEAGDVLWYSPTDLTKNQAMFINDSSKKISRKGLAESSARLFPAYSVMMTSRATLGVISINTCEASTNQGFITCIPNERLHAYQIYYWLEENKNEMISRASGATFKEITKASFRKHLIAVPDKDLKNRFLAYAEILLGEIDTLHKKNANLRKTRDLLLPKLISGEVDVEELDIDTRGVEQ